MKFFYLPLPKQITCSYHRWIGCSGYLQSLRLEDADLRFNNIERAHKATFDWVSENPVLKAWMTEKSSQIVWVTGKPGSGKSTIAKHVVEKLKAQEKSQKPSTATPIVSIFFSDRGDKVLNSVKGFFQMLLYQLQEQRPVLFSLFPGKAEDLRGKLILVGRYAEGFSFICDGEERGKVYSNHYRCLRRE